jgi:hypothetical protein
MIALKDKQQRAMEAGMRRYEKGLKERSFRDVTVV